VVLSAVADQMPMEELKAFARMSKPFDPEQLVRTVRRACEFNGHGMSGAPTPSKPSTPSNPSKPSQQ
jgi:hypothetical protein